MFAGRFPLLKQALPYLELACAAVAGVLWYQGGGAVWYAGGWPGPRPLVLLALAWLFHLLRIGFRPGVSPFDVAVAIFLSSAGFSLWAAYDPGPAWAKYWLIVGAIGLYYAVSHQTDLPHLYTTLAFFGVLGVALSFYFFATNDWTGQSKVPVLGELGKAISARWPSLSAHRMHPNVTGGMLAAFLPVYAPLIVLARRSATPHVSHLARWGLPALWSVAAGIAGFTCLLTMSRGAWLAAVSALGLWAAWRVTGRWASRHYGQAERVWTARLRAMGLMGLGVLLVLALLMALVWTGRLPGMVTLTSRLGLLRDSASLARDYGLIGAGLGTFRMQYSIYALLISVPYIVFSHNVFVDLLIEQGLAGLLSYLLFVVAGVVYGLRYLRRASPNTAWVIETGLVVLAVMTVHGLVDDVFYGSRALLLWLVPLALILAAARAEGQTVAVAQPDQARGQPRRWDTAWVAAGLGLLALAGLLWRSPVMASWYANLGAVEQSRVELAAYDSDHFATLTLNQVRQAADLSVAERAFARALEWDPANLTAHQRLGAIALSRGQYESGLAHLQAAWAAGYRDDVTRLLRGDALVATGQVEEAADTVRGVVRAEGRLLGEAWYTYWVHGDYRRAADAWATVVLLNPANTEAARQAAEARKRAGERQ